MSGYPQPIVPVDHVEPVPRRIRAELGGGVVLDTTDALYLWEWPPYPQFLIPAGDVDPERRWWTRSTSATSAAGASRGWACASATGAPGRGPALRGVHDPGHRRHDPLRLRGAGRLVRGGRADLRPPPQPVLARDAVRSAGPCGSSSTAWSSRSPPRRSPSSRPGCRPRWYLERISRRLLAPASRPTRRPPAPTRAARRGYWSVQTGEALYPDLAWTYDFPTAPAAADRGPRRVLRREGRRVPRRRRAGAAGHALLRLRHPCLTVCGPRVGGCLAETPGRGTMPSRFAEAEPEATPIVVPDRHRPRGAGASTRRGRFERAALGGLRIAMLAPPWIPVPPPGYGGIESVVSAAHRRAGPPRERR